MSIQDAGDAGRTVLVISYYFPPSGGPGVQRVLKFARYLPDFGYRPVILTVPETAAFPLRDPSLAAEIPAGTRVVRSPILEFYRLYRSAAGEEGRGSSGNLGTSVLEPAGHRARFLRWLRGALFVPDGRMGWLPGGTRAALRTGREEEARLIFASGPPFTAHWIARLAADRLGLPLVLDFRDPWTRAPFYPRRPGWARRLDERLERSCLRRADAVVTVNRAIREELCQRHPELDARRFHLITNGYDPADFPDPAPPPLPGWVITHAGTLPNRRFPPAFAGALRTLLDEDAEALSLLRIRMIGLAGAEHLQMLSIPPLDRVIRFEGYQPHAASVQALLQSRLLLLFIEEGPQAKGILTGKLFEYLGAGVPVLALAPEGEAAELIRRAGCGRVVHGDDEPAVLAALREAVQAWRAGRRPFGQPDPAVVTEFTRPALTGKLAAVFDRLLDR